MRFYIKGYYGYKNLGDEFLLLGLLSRLVGITADQGPIEHIVIETKDEQWLSRRLKENNSYIGIPSDLITTVGPRNRYKNDPAYIKLFGGGEVVSDARPFPYNGRTYLLTFANTIFKNRFWVLGGVGTEKKLGTNRLYKQFLGRAERIVVREKSSYDIVKKYSDKAQLYQDFCLDLLKNKFPKSESETTNKNTKQSKPNTKQVLINVNKYIRNDDTKQKIQKLIEQFPGANFWFMPAEIGSDDALLPKLQELIPTVQVYDRTKHSVEETCKFIQGLDYGMAARLHILLLLDYFGVPILPLVYQEKIVKMLLSTVK